MRDTTRPRSFFWLAGFLLLIGTAVGTGVMLNNGTGQTPTDKKAEAPPPGIVCIGITDIEGGIVDLYPVQQGRVVAIPREGQPVKKGEVLLRLDNRLAKLRVQEAEADLKASEALLSQAEKLPAQHEEKIKQQKAGIEAAKHQQAAAEEEFKIKEKAFKDKVINLNEKNAVEQGKLKELMLLDPGVNIDRAQADVAAKQARLEQARLALQECDLAAPMDGMVLRVFTNVGEILGANPKSPAIQFAPKGPKIVRAEVLQEWASKVQLGNSVVIEDDTSAGPRWSGQVKEISNYYTQKRNVIHEPFIFNDARTLECIIEVSAEDSQALRIGQRVRVTIR